ncbi:MAG: helix-turn-helix domain-containing protein [Nostoc sp.]|uniref:helix-turn-helix domain-containing protein n=1 Tax=Nostoc sp. TaxID=1180 RepID=UPI002FFA82F6
MYKPTADRLKEGALAIEKFRTLADSEQEWLLELLKVGKSAILALKILDAISANPLTFEEIADICECNPQTVSQMLNALEQGGMTIQMDETSAYAPTGRLRKLVRR